MNLELYELQKHHKYLQLVLTILNQTNMNFISLMSSHCQLSEMELNFVKIVWLFHESSCLLHLFVSFFKKMETNLQHEDLLIKLRAKLNEEKVKLWESPFIAQDNEITQSLKVRYWFIFVYIFVVLIGVAFNNYKQLFVY